MEQLNLTGVRTISWTAPRRIHSPDRPAVQLSVRTPDAGMGQGIPQKR